MEEEGNERSVLSEEEVTDFFFNQPTAKGLTIGECRNREQTQEHRDFILKYLSHEPPVFACPVEEALWHLRYGHEQSFKPICPNSDIGTTRTRVESIGGSVQSEDLSMMENLNPATVATSGTKFEANGGSVQNGDQISENRS